MTFMRIADCALNRRKNFAIKSKQHTVPQKKCGEIKFRRIKILIFRPYIKNPPISAKFSKYL